MVDTQPGRCVLPALLPAAGPRRFGVAHRALLIEKLYAFHRCAAFAGPAGFSVAHGAFGIEQPHASQIYSPGTSPCRFGIAHRSFGMKELDAFYGGGGGAMLVFG